MKTAKKTLSPRAWRGALKGTAALAALLAVAVLGPIAGSRMSEQQTNTLWAQRAETFNDMFSIDAASARENGYRLTDNARDETIWRMARTYTDNRPLEALARDRDVLSAYQTFAQAHFDQAERQARERKCLADAIYYEARSETRSSRLAVAEVVLNRTRHPLYPDTICDVVYQGSHRTTGCQFSFTCDGSMAIRPRGQAWREANSLAAYAMLGLPESYTDGATHYHANYVMPYWAPNLVQTSVVGTHIFYRFPGKAGRLPEEL